MNKTKQNKQATTTKPTETHTKKAKPVVLVNATYNNGSLIHQVVDF